MREICIPIANFGEDEIADVTLTVGGRKVSYSFRVESFPWTFPGEVPISDTDEGGHATLAQIIALRIAIEQYDKGWELVQIYTPPRGASHIQVLYRKKN
ncbi:MAG: hypothetical protein JW783_07920 [Bacteroidales bacterium]|nr:hypothetical protein [Bacteroidales bacterium]MBN2749866.1 hypothetical protein [Bacteroidales bacterium]